MTIETYDAIREIKRIDSSTRRTYYLKDKQIERLTNTIKACQERIEKCKQEKCDILNDGLNEANEVLERCSAENARFKVGDTIKCNGTPIVVEKVTGVCERHGNKLDLYCNYICMTVNNGETRKLSFCDDGKTHIELVE